MQHEIPAPAPLPILWCDVRGDAIRRPNLYADMPTTAAASTDAGAVRPGHEATTLAETPEIAMTAFLARCHRELKASGYRFVVSYADPTENGTVRPKPRTTPWQAGGIYAAANFKYLGKVRPERHFRDADGNFVHRRVPYLLMKRRIKVRGRFSAKR